MRPTKMLLSMLLLASILSAFTVDNYLYQGEEITSEETFIIHGVHYKLIFVDEEPVFLLRDGELATDRAEIETALVEHYTTIYYPSGEELQELEDAFRAYDDSRENGDWYKDVEEEECRMSLFLHAFPCTNETDCVLTSYVICEEYGDYVGCMDPADIRDDIEQFAFASNGMEEHTGRIYALIGNISPSTIHQSLAEIQSMIPDMQGYEEDMETSRFRLPVGGEKCNDCWGICPPIDIDADALTTATNKLSIMMDKTASFGDYSAQAQEMSEGAAEREEYYLLNQEREYYHSFIDPWIEDAEEALEDADELFDHISNSSLESTAERVEELVEGINDSLEEAEFSSINSSLDELESKTNVLDDAIDAQWEIYNSTFDAKAEAASMLFVLETTQLSAEDEATVDTLAAKKRTLDRSLVDGLSAERYLELREEYQEVITDLSPLLNDVERTSSVTSAFKAAGKKTNEGFIGLVETVQPMDRAGRDELSSYAPMVFASISFFSLASLLTFMFLFVFGALSHVFRKRTVLFLGLALLVAGIVFVGALSAGVYFVTKAASTDADFRDFQSAVAGADEVSILIESEGVTSGAVDQMRACAQKISGDLSPQQVKVYERTNSECIAPGDSTLEDCYNSVPEPLITLRYSAVATRPAFTTAFVEQAVFAGDEMYFEECAFSAMFSMPAELGAPVELPEGPEAEADETGGEE